MIRFSTAALVFGAVSTAAALLLGLIWGDLQSWMPPVCFLPGAAAALPVLLRSAGPEENLPSPAWLDRLILAAFAVFFLRLFLYYFYEQNGQWYTLNNIHMALPETLARVQYFAAGQGFWPDNPVFADSPFLNFGLDLLSAVFSLAKVPMTSFLPVSGMFLGLIALAALYRWAGGAGPGGFLFLGGSAGWSLLFYKPVAGFTDVYRESAAYAMLGMMQFIADRGFQFALPAGVFVLWSWRRRLILNESGLRSSVENILWLSLALFHFPSFLAVSAAGIFWALSGRRWKDAFFFLAGAGLFAAVFGGYGEGGLRFFSVEPNPRENPLWTFSRRYGHVSLFFSVLTAAAVFRKDSKALRTMLPGLLLFTGLLFFQMSPWKFDGNKTLIVWAFLFFLPVFSEACVRLKTKAAAWAAAALLFFPGFLMQFNAMAWFYTPVPIVESQTLREVQKKLSLLPRGYRYLTQLEIQHPVPLSGFASACSFNDYWSLDRAPQIRTAAAAREALLGFEGWNEKARRTGARFLFWGESEKESYEQSLRPWEKNARKVAEGAWGEVYDLGAADVWGPLPEGNQGLRGTLYANAEGQGEPLLGFRVRDVDFTWDDSRTSVLTPPWSVVFEGEIYIPESGETVFYLLSDDGARMEINGEMLIADKGPHPKQISSGKRLFNAGWYPVRIFYYELFGGTSLRLWWMLPSGREELIPREYLRS